MLFSDTVSRRGREFSSTEDREKRRFAYTNMNKQPTCLVNRKLENNTLRGRVMSLSTSDVTVPPVLYVVKLVFSLMS